MDKLNTSKIEIIKEEAIYRLVRCTTYWNPIPVIDLYIEKHKKFLWWSWWSSCFSYKGSHKFGVHGYFTEYTVEEGLRHLDILNKKSPDRTIEILA